MVWSCAVILRACDLFGLCEPGAWFLMNMVDNVGDGVSHSEDKNSAEHDRGR